MESLISSQEIFGLLLEKLEEVVDTAAKCSLNHLELTVPQSKLADELFGAVVSC